MNNKDFKRTIFMRHGCALENTDGYEGLDYEKFMCFVQKKIDPPLLNNYKLGKIPQNIDIIYHSPILRAKQTAKLLKKELNNKPIISDEFINLLNEVKFSENIILKNEFENDGNFNNITRKLVLNRWYLGENEETFEQSIGRIKKLDYELTKTPHENILLITHAWILRLIHLFYQKKVENRYRNLTKSDFKLVDLFNAPKYDYGDFLEYLPYLNKLQMHKQPIQKINS